MTSATWIVAVCFCETWDRCREGVLNPETGRYSGVVVRLTGLCVKIPWLMYFPFGLEQPYRTSLDGWMSTEISASQFYCETSSMVFVLMIASVICLRWIWHFLW